MQTKTRWLWLFLAVLVTTVVLVTRHNQRPRPFLLEVVNASSATVDQVRIFGSALEQDAVLFGVEPAGSGELTVAVKPSGTLRFEVTQGQNRIDTYIVEDTLLLEQWQQRLTIHDNNRFILGTKP